MMLMHLWKTGGANWEKPVPKAWKERLTLFFDIKAYSKKYILTKIEHKFKPIQMNRHNHNQDKKIQEQMLYLTFS